MKRKEWLEIDDCLSQEELGGEQQLTGGWEDSAVFGKQIIH